MTMLLKLTFLMCALVFAGAQDDILFEEPTVLPGRVSDINPEQDFIMDEEAHGFKPGSRQEILESIVTLKAYSELAYDEAKRLQEFGTVGNSGLVHFVVAFGEKPKENTKTNVITAFATAIGQSKGRFTKGMNHYLLMHLGKAVFEGKSTLALSKIHGENAMIFDSKEMGLESRPQYFKKLPAPQMAYLTLQEKIKAASKDADARAAAAWLASGSKAEYKSFKQKAQDSVDKKEDAFKNDMYMNSLKAIKTAWEGSHSLAPLPMSGNKASASVPALEVPTPEEVDAAAKKAAAAWGEENKKEAAEKAQEQAEKDAAAKEEQERVEKAKAAADKAAAEKVIAEAEQAEKEKKEQEENQKEMAEKSAKEAMAGVNGSGSGLGLRTTMQNNSTLRTTMQNNSTLRTTMQNNSTDVTGDVTDESLYATDWV